MKLCVGAASRRIVEEAAKLQVHQIVASRRQVNADGGYIGLTPETLVTTVSTLSNDVTQVVRDHGGPGQGGFKDDGVEALDLDVAAGFDGLHLDVCMLPQDVQRKTLVVLCDRYAGKAALEIGGEHEHASWNTELLDTVRGDGIVPAYAVIGVGTHVWADQQIGRVRRGIAVSSALTFARRLGVKTKAHNMDWIGGRLRYGDTFDAYNLAPELGQVEVRAILTMLPSRVARSLLDYAYNTARWTRWFHTHEGTHQARAECALRYLLEDPHALEIIDPAWSDEAEMFVRGCVRDTIKHG